MKKSGLRRDGVGRRGRSVARRCRRIDADGTNRYKLVTRDEGDERYPSMSPDGKRLLFRGDADGTGRVRVTTDPRFDIGPTWSPDGRMIAFTRSAGPSQPGDVWIMNADGSNQRALTSTDVIEESPLCEAGGYLKS